MGNLGGGGGGANGHKVIANVSMATNVCHPFTRYLLKVFKIRKDRESF